MYLSTLMNKRCRHEALRNTSVRKMVVWHNCRPHCRLGPYFWVMAMRGKMTTPTGKSAKARLTIKALVAERSFLLITTATMTKPLPEERKLGQKLQKSKLDFRRFLESGLRSSQRREWVRGRSAGSFPEQRLVIEPTEVRLKLNKSDATSSTTLTLTLQRRPIFTPYFFAVRVVACFSFACEAYGKGRL